MRELLILILATWRFSSLLADEDGPFNLFSGIRKLAGIHSVMYVDHTSNEIAMSEDGVELNELAAGLICKWCNSVWIGAFITLVLWIRGNKLASPGLPFALSSGSIVVDRWING